VPAAGEVAEPAKAKSRFEKPVSAIKWLGRPGFTQYAGMTGLTPFYQFKTARYQWSEVSAEKEVLKHPSFIALDEDQRYLARTRAIKGFDQAKFERGLTRTFKTQLILFPCLILVFLGWYLTAGLVGGAFLFFGIMVVLSSLCLLSYLFASYVYIVTARRKSLIGIRAVFQELLRGTHGR
jgi:hypothetical protein